MTVTVLVIVLLITTITISGFLYNPTLFKNGRPTTYHELAMAMDLKTIEIPIQQDTSHYQIEVNKIFPDEQVIRWYIAKIIDGIAHVEVVYEDCGVGNSR